MAELHLSAGQLAELRAILEAQLPAGAIVQVFGSRATGIHLKPWSDLDLLIDTPGGLSLRTMADLREKLTESRLPFSVDLLETRCASPQFLEALPKDGLVTLLSRTVP